MGVAIDSVLRQTYADLELIVVDDGSVDRTSEEVGARTDPRVRFLRTENGGVSVARNRGLAVAVGELVAFLDADDAWQPQKVERQRQILRAQMSVGLCFTSALLVDDDLRKVGIDAAVQSTDYAEQLLVCGNIVPGGGSSVMAQRSLIDQAGGFDPNLSQCADWDLWLRLSLITRFAAIPEPLVLYRHVTGTMSSDPALLERDTFALLDKFYSSAASSNFEHVRRRAYAHHWMVCGGSYLQAGRLGNALRCVTRGVRSDARTLQRPLGMPARRIARAARRLGGHRALANRADRSSRRS